MDVHAADAATGPRCSSLSARWGEPLAGTTSFATTWLCVEQPGPWGRDALVASHLDPDVGRELVRLAGGTGVRTVLIRRPGSHPDRHRPVPHRVYLAHTAPGRTWLERAWVSDPKELLDLDFAAVGAGVPSGLGELVSAPLLLMCTNGRRDVCCALRGRPVAVALAGAYGERVWECTHLGGHRFSPTGLALPTGYCYGRLEVDLAHRLLGERPGVPVEHCRGRSTWSPAGQVAELAVRASIGEQDPDALDVTAGATVTDPVPAAVAVSHVDGRTWRVRVWQRTAEDWWPASCSGAAKPVTYLEAMP